VTRRKRLRYGGWFPSVEKSPSFWLFIRSRRKGGRSGYLRVAAAQNSRADLKRLVSINEVSTGEGVFGPKAPQPHLQALLLPKGVSSGW